MRHSLAFVATAMLAGFLTAACTIAPPPVDTAPLQTEMTRLADRQEELSAQVERLQTNLTLAEARLQDQQQLIDELRRKAMSQMVTTAGEKASAVESTPLPAGETSASRSPTEVYLQAFADYASGRFDRAITGFETFLRHFPNNDYAGNAQYWLGECFYSRQEYERAATEFRKTVDAYPQGAKAPEALLKMAAALRQMNEPARAEEALKLLRSRYPESAAAQKALPGN